MRIILVLTISCCGLFAQGPSKNAKIEEFLTLIKANAIEQQIYAQLGQQIDRVTQGIAQQAGIPAPEQASAIADLRAKMTAAMKQRMNWDKMKPGVVQVYGDVYTEPELDALIAFFKSPTGQAYITKSPTISAKTRELAEGQVKELSMEFQAMTNEWMTQHGKAPAPK